MEQVILNGKSCGVLRSVIPLRMHLYCRALAWMQGLSLRALHTQCAQEFLRAKPWEHGLNWRTSPSLDKVSEWEWVDVPFPLPFDLGFQLVRLAEQSMPVESVLYTMLFWYTWAVVPPLHEQLRRKQGKEDFRSCQNSSR